MLDTVPNLLKLNLRKLHIETSLYTRVISVIKDIKEGQGEESKKG